MNNDIFFDEIREPAYLQTSGNRVIVLTGRVLIVLRSQTGTPHKVEFPLEENNLILFLDDAKERGSWYLQLVLEVLQDWVLLFRELVVARMNPDTCLNLTKVLSQWVDSTDFTTLNEKMEGSRKTGGFTERDYEQIKYDLYLLRAKYSKNVKNEWPFIDQVMKQGALRAGTRVLDMRVEEDILSVIYDPDNGVKAQLIVDSEKMDRVTKWLASRLALKEIFRLTRDKRRTEKLMAKSINDMIRKARHALAEGNNGMAQMYLTNALLLSPHDTRLIKLGEKAGLLDEPQASEPSQSAFLSVFALPSIVLGALWLLLFVYAGPKFVVLASRYNQDPQLILLQGDILPTILFITIYGITLSYLLKSVFNSPAITDSLRRYMLFAFLCSGIPLLRKEWLLDSIRWPEAVWIPYAIIAIIAIIIVFYKDIYYPALRTLNDSIEARQRTILTFGLVAGQALIFTVIFSDLAARQLLYNDLTPLLKAHEIADATVFGVIPKLVIVPPIGIYGFHIFPSAVLLWWLASLLAGVLQKGISFLARPDQKD